MTAQDIGRQFLEEGVFLEEGFLSRLENQVFCFT